MWLSKINFAKTLKFKPEDYLIKLDKYIKGYHLSDNNGQVDSNKIINKNTWFWPYLNNKLNYYSLEVYNYDIKSVVRVFNLTKRKLKK